jgi:homogentisate 1,2-dioxygenase
MTRLVIRPTRFSVETPALQHDYDACWAGSGKYSRAERV